MKKRLSGRNLVKIPMPKEKEAVWMTSCLRQATGRRILRMLMDEMTETQYENLAVWKEIEDFAKAEFKDFDREKHEISIDYITREVYVKEIDQTYHV